MSANPLRIGDEPLTVYNIDIGKRRSAGDSMSALGIAMPERAAVGFVMPEYFKQLLGDGGRAQRQIAAC